MDSQKREVILLRVRNLLEDRKIIHATAERQMAVAGEWLWDYASESHEKSREIAALLETLEATNEH
jgi:hypothetical protein